MFFCALAKFRPPSVRLPTSPAITTNHSNRSLTTTVLPNSLPIEPFIRQQKGDPPLVLPTPPPRPLPSLQQPPPNLPIATHTRVLKTELIRKHSHPSSNSFILPGINGYSAIPAMCTASAERQTGNSCCAGYLRVGRAGGACLSRMDLVLLEGEW